MSATVTPSTSSSASVRRFSAARVATVAGLAVGTVGILIMKLGGAGMPAVPPGAVLMVIAAVLVATVRSRWAAVPAVLVALMEVIAVMVTLTDLGDDAVVSIGTVVRAIGVVTALAAAATVLIRDK